MSLSLLIRNTQTAVLNRRSRHPENRHLLVLELVMQMFNDIKPHQNNINHTLPSRRQLIYRNQLHRVLHCLLKAELIEGT